MPVWTYSGNVYNSSPAGTTAFPLVSEAGNPIGYLKRSHIHVSYSADSGQTWLELSTPSEYGFNTAGTEVILVNGIADGVFIKVERQTPYLDEYVNFQSSSLLTADQLNTAELFSMYVDQELSDKLALASDSSVAEAPDDGKLYGRESKAWVEVPPPGISEAPNDGKLYGRESEAWMEVPPPGISEAPIDSKDYVRSNSAWKEAIDYILPIASASILGGVKVGANLAINGAGVLSATGGGGIVYKGLADFTSTAPLNPNIGDLYLNDTAGLGAWPGFIGTGVGLDDRAFFNGVEWDRLPGGGDSYWTQAGNDLYPGTATSDVKIGGTLPSAPNIQLKADGSAEYNSGQFNLATFKRTAAGGGVQIALENGNAGSRTFTNDASGHLFFGYNGSNQAAITNSGNLQVGGTLTSAPNIQLNADGSAYYSDRVGIGVTPPLAPLHVSASSSNNILQLSRSDANGHLTVNFASQDTNFDSYKQYVFNQQGVEKARIDSSGNVLIGGTLPSAPNITLDSSGLGSFVGLKLPSLPSESVLATDANGTIIAGTAGGGAVDSVNTQTGVVVLDADDIDDTSTTHKFATAAELTSIGTALQPVDIGVTVQSYDANTVVSDSAPTFTATIQTTERTITAGSFDLATANHWTCGSITVPAPTNAVAGTSGVIRITAGPVTWNTAFKFPGGSAPALANFPAIIPFYVQSASIVLLGNATEGIS